MEMIAAFILGIAAGLWWYRFYVINITNRFPFKRCDYCEFRMIEKELFPQKKKK